MADHTIVGKLLDKPEERDAIHVAVAAVIAAGWINPGQHIGFAGNDTETVISEPPEGWGSLYPIGIADPFLPHQVDAGERFWMFLYPNTITSLKHQWTHPAFGPEEKVTASPSAVEASKTWIREFAEGYDFTYSKMLGAAKAYVERGDYLCGGSELEGERVPDEFWVHYDIVTSTHTPVDERQNFFTCSC